MRHDLILRAAARPAALAIIGLALWAAPPAAAQQRPAAPAAKPAEPKPLGKFDAWTPAEVAEGRAKTCYMFAAPAASEPKGARRDDILLVVTHRPAEKQQDEVSFQAGYSIKKDSAVTLDIDGKKFAFFSTAAADDTAWLKDPDGDKALIAALRGGKTAKMSATSARNTATVDTFSLGGFVRAYGEIGKACNIK